MAEPSNNQPSTWKSRLDLVATILLIVVTLVVGGLALADRLTPEGARDVGVKPVLTSISMPLEDAPVKGSKNAKVALIVFSDFECPVCRRAAREIMPQIEAQYVNTGKVLFVWRHYPLERHLLARGAAESTECAARQARFWELHDWAFANQQQIRADRLREEAGRLGLDMAAFDKCVGGEASDRITADIALADQLGVSATPTWFIGTVESTGTVKLVDQITGVGPVEMYAKAIDRVARSR